MSSPLSSVPGEPLAQPEAGRLRLLSYNVQVGISSTRPHHYVTHSWKHLLAHERRFRNLDNIARVLAGFDIVALQEVDAGSQRTGFINLTEYLAGEAGFPFWFHQVNRDLAGIARHSNGLLSRFRPLSITEFKLPGIIPGRGALVSRYGTMENPITVIMLHLALGRRTRQRQLEFVAELVNEYPHAVVMGDLNCSADSPEMKILFDRTSLSEPVGSLCTFPSWRPARPIDHILVTDGLRITSCEVLGHAHSDHLPIAMEVTLPDGFELSE